MVKRRTSRIDCHIPIVTKDGKKVALTVTCFTLNRANLSQVHAIRGTITEKVKGIATQIDLETLLNGIVNGEISKELFKDVKTIFPVRRVEIIKSKVEAARTA